MIVFLPLLLRIAGVGLVLLAVVHVPIGKRLKWKEQGALLSPENQAVFHVHTFFICVTLLLMGLPCLLAPEVFLEKSGMARWMAWSFCGFWLIRLYCQWFVYGTHLWRGKRLETGIHYLFTGLWLALAIVFGLCGAVQSGWLI